MPKLAQIDRVDQQRYCDVNAGLESDLITRTGPDGDQHLLRRAADDKDDAL